MIEEIMLKRQNVRAVLLDYSNTLGALLIKVHRTIEVRVAAAYYQHTFPVLFVTSWLL